ncbi:MAG: TRAP transporter large permease [Clostridiales Family XIII bacterium]|jgi:C4-dicarboxylate transporter DctM subunit|nr:TRAP transporter large permease [Clostridiales Family XIII bacterium]
MNTLLLLVVLFALLIAILLIGTPIGLGIGFLGVAGILAFLSPKLLAQLCTITYNQATSVTTLMIPMFILMAEFLANSNMAADLFEVISRRLKRLPANLAISSVVSSAIFSAVCGSAPATAATLGRISIPTMLKKGYSATLAGGTQAAGGNLGILIPPSINFILYGMITETNVVKLFMAGVFPGILIALMMIVYILVRNKLDPGMIVPPAESADEAAEKPSPSLGFDIVTVVPILVLILVIFGILYSGIATATESAAIGAIGAAVVVLIQRRMTADCVKKTLLNTTSTSCMILFLMFGGLVFALFLTVLGLPQELSGLVVNASPNRWITFIVVNIIFIILGCFMEPLSIMLIVLPFVFPFMKALGFDPVWLGVVITINCAIGMITPPVGMNLFVLKGATGLPISDIIRGVIPYIAIFALAIILLCVFPGIATFLPGSM